MLLLLLLPITQPWPRQTPLQTLQTLLLLLP
jgi:hypothetical protein